MGIPLRKFFAIDFKACNKRGLTLLELLLVLLIMSAVAWMSLASLTGGGNQIRFEDTRNRLRAIRAATLGESGVSSRENSLHSGYVVDNGLLPENIRFLRGTPAGFRQYGLTQPVFDPTPDINGYNDGVGVETTLSQAKNQLMKGHRGFYLVGLLGGRFRDGWGTTLNPGGATANCPALPTLPAGAVAKGSNLDTDNDGWCVTLVDNNALYVASYGMDGGPDPAPPAIVDDPYEEDVAMEEPVLADDWRINLLGTSVKIVNESGADIFLDSPTTRRFRASLLVFENNDAGGRWLRVTSDPTPLGLCLDGNGDGICNGNSAEKETVVQFNTAAFVPIGEHLLVLVDDPDGVPHTADDALYPSPSPLNPDPITARIRLFSRSSAPEAILRIR